MWAPPSRRVLADQPVDGLAEQFGVPGMPAVLLDQIAHEPAQTGVATLVVGDVDELVEPAVGKGRVQPRPGSHDRAVPERVEVVGESSAAVRHGQFGSASQSPDSHGSPGGAPLSSTVE